METSNLIKLNLGCGDLIYPDCINVDLYSDKADVKMDIRKLDYPDNYADEIRAYHVLEHITCYEVMPTLKEWNRVLKSGGRLIIELPNILELCKAFDSSNKNERYRLLDCIYGTTMPDYPHKYGWYPEILMDHLYSAGFVDIMEKPIELTHHWGINFRVECLKR